MSLSAKTAPAHTSPRHETRYFFSFIWAVVIGANLITLTIFKAGERNYTRYMENDFNGEVMADFVAAKEKADISVVLLGNSRLRHAVTFGFDPAKLAVRADGRTVSALQFAFNAARFDHYQGLADDLLATQPDILVIQENILSNQKPVTPDVIKFSSMAFNYWYSLFHEIDDEAQWLADRYEIMPFCYEQLVESDLEKQLQFNKRRDSHTLNVKENDNLPVARDVIRKARESGIKVVMLRIPPNIDVLNTFDVPQHQTDFYGLPHMPTHEELLPAQASDVTWLDYPAQRADHYCDFVHFNAVGRTTYSAWLLEHF